MKHLCLDIGNVICHLDFNNFLNVLSKSINISREDAIYFLNRTQKLHDLGLTLMKDELRDHFKIHTSVIIDDILQAWMTSVAPDLIILDGLNNLINKYPTLKIALLSNINLEHAELMKKILDHDKFYQNVIKHFSCFVGARKPSLVYYQSFLIQYPEFKGALYIDDLQGNLDSAVNLNFEVHRFALDAYQAPLESRTAGFYDSFFKEIEELLNK